LCDKNERGMLCLQLISRVTKTGRRTKREDEV
jgi:hypothetical protein